MKILDASGLLSFQRLQPDAARAVSARLHASLGARLPHLGPDDWELLRTEMAFHLEFLRPVLEFGMLQPLVDDLRWIAAVLDARNVPAEQLAQALDWLGEYFGCAMAPADAGVVVEALRLARARFLETWQSPPVPPSPPEAWPQAADFEAALLAGSARDAHALVNRCLDEGRSLVDVELHVIEPSLYAIGEKWQANRVTVAQEHVATAIVESVMTAALLRSPAPSPTGRRALLACVEGNRHVVGLRMVADAFLLDGWDVQYLGVDVPTSALLQAVTDARPDLIGLSVSFPQHLRVVRTVVDTLAARLGHARPAVIVGGLAINRFTQLVQALGADASSPDARAAVDSAGRIVGRKAGA